MHKERKKIDMALADMMMNHLCEMEAQLLEARGTDKEPEAKARLKAGIKELNKVLEGVLDESGHSVHNCFDQGDHLRTPFSTGNNIIY